MTEEKPAGKLTMTGLRLLQASPASRSIGLGERTLIERWGGLGAYADYQRMIQELVTAGYLTRDAPGGIRRTATGDAAAVSQISTQKEQL